MSYLENLWMWKHYQQMESCDVQLTQSCQADSSTHLVHVASEVRFDERFAFSASYRFPFSCWHMAHPPLQTCRTTAPSFPAHIPSQLDLSWDAWRKRGHRWWQSVQTTGQNWIADKISWFIISIMVFHWLPIRIPPLHPPLSLHAQPFSSQTSLLFSIVGAGQWLKLPYTCSQLRDRQPLP